MARHITDAEPSLALFVPDTDPLLFYRALADFARQHLLPGGGIFVEIHEDLASGVLDIFSSAGFQQLTLRKDMQGRDRMIKAVQNSI
jgi:release factor glutamine methyltransferase